MKRNNSLYFGLGIGIVGILLLLLNFISLFGRGTSLQKISDGIYSFSISYYPLGIIPLYLTGFAFLGVLFLSLVGINFSVKSLNSPQRKHAIFAIVLNSINLIFALFIAWLLFGLARGM